MSRLLQNAAQQMSESLKSVSKLNTLFFMLHSPDVAKYKIRPSISCVFYVAYLN